MLRQLGLLLLPQESRLVLQGDHDTSSPCVARLPQLPCPAHICRLQLPSLHFSCARRGLRPPVNRYHPAGSQPVTVHSEYNRWDYFNCLCSARNHILGMTLSHLKAPLCNQAAGKKCPPRLCCRCSLPSVTTPGEVMPAAWQLNTATDQNGNQNGAYNVQLAVERAMRQLCPPALCLPGT